jgi:hypothetical protein
VQWAFWGQKEEALVDRLKKEYDAFGPWLTVIKTEDGIPPQYIEERNTILDSIYCFKVPRNIERRDARPGMLLYEAVVALFDTKVIILRRKEGSVERFDVSYEDIVYIQNTTDLLMSTFTLATKDYIQTVDYKPIPEDVMDRTVHIIREKCFARSKRFDISDIPEHIVVESQLFKNLLREEVDDDKEIKLVEYQPFVELVRNTPTPKDRVKDLYSRPVLQDCMFLTNGKELIIINRNKEVKGKKDPDYSYKHTYTSLDQITDLTFKDEPELKNLQRLTIVLGSLKITRKVSDEVSLKTLKSVIS